jgi:hypothetical protein
MSNALPGSSLIAAKLDDLDIQHIVDFLLSDYEENCNEDEDFDPEWKQSQLEEEDPTVLVQEFRQAIGLEGAQLDEGMNLDNWSDNLVTAFGLVEYRSRQRRSREIEEKRREDLWSLVKTMRLVSVEQGMYQDLGNLTKNVQDDIARLRVSFLSVEKLIRSWQDHGES